MRDGAAAIAPGVGQHLVSCMIFMPHFRRPKKPPQEWSGHAWFRVPRNRRACELSHFADQAVHHVAQRLLLRMSFHAREHVAAMMPVPLQLGGRKRWLGMKTAQHFW